METKRPARKKTTHKRRAAGSRIFSRANRDNKGDLGPLFPFIAAAEVGSFSRSLRKEKERKGASTTRERERKKDGGGGAKEKETEGLSRIVLYWLSRHQ